VNCVNCNGTRDILVRVRWLQWHEEGGNGRPDGGTRKRTRSSRKCFVTSYLQCLICCGRSRAELAQWPSHDEKPSLPPFRVVRDDELGQIRVENSSRELRPMDQRQRIRVESGVERA
jgi:hypothetical protein